MKTAKLLVLLALGLLLSSCAANGGSFGQSYSLEGTWYSGGDSAKIARIVDTRNGLEARNEHGQTSRLEYDGRGRVLALDWGGLAGEVRGDRIEWSNKTFWARRANR
jgi:YD repeat-containing protein